MSSDSNGHAPPYQPDPADAGPSNAPEVPMGKAPSPPPPVHGVKRRLRSTDKLVGFKSHRARGATSVKPLKLIRKGRPSVLRRLHHQAKMAEAEAFARKALAETSTTPPGSPSDTRKRTRRIGVGADEEASGHSADQDDLMDGSSEGEPEGMEEDDDYTEGDNGEKGHEEQMEYEVGSAGLEGPQPREHHATSSAAPHPSALLQQGVSAQPGPQQQAVSNAPGLALFSGPQPAYATTAQESRPDRAHAGVQLYPEGGQPSGAPPRQRREVQEAYPPGPYPSGSQPQGAHSPQGPQPHGVFSAMPYPPGSQPASTHPPQGRQSNAAYSVAGYAQGPTSAHMPPGPQPHGAYPAGPYSQGPNPQHALGPPGLPPPGAYPAGLYSQGSQLQNAQGPQGPHLQGAYSATASQQDPRFQQYAQGMQHQGAYAGPYHQAQGVYPQGPQHQGAYVVAQHGQVPQHGVAPGSAYQPQSQPSQSTSNSIHSGSALQRQRSYPPPQGSFDPPGMRFIAEDPSQPPQKRGVPLSRQSTASSVDSTVRGTPPPSSSGRAKTGRVPSSLRGHKEHAYHPYDPPPQPTPYVPPPRVSASVPPPALQPASSRGGPPIGPRSQAPNTQSNSAAQGPQSGAPHMPAVAMVLDKVQHVEDVFLDHAKQSQKFQDAMRGAVEQVQRDVANLTSGRAGTLAAIMPHATKAPRKVRQSRLKQVGEHLPPDFNTWTVQDRSVWLRRQKDQLDLLSRHFKKYLKKTLEFNSWGELVDNHPPLSDAQIELFAKRGTTIYDVFPDKKIHVDFEQSWAKFPFNREARKVLIADFLSHVQAGQYCNPPVDALYLTEHHVGESLDTYIDTCRRSYRAEVDPPSDDEKDRRADNACKGGRRRTLLQQRKLSAERRGWEKYDALFNRLVPANMSDDETDSEREETSSRRKGKAKAKAKAKAKGKGKEKPKKPKKRHWPRWTIIRSLWQSDELVECFHSLDKHYRRDWENPGRYSKQRRSSGQPPRRRLLKEGTRTEDGVVPKGLWRNCYSQEWVDTLREEQVVALQMIDEDFDLSLPYLAEDTSDEDTSDEDASDDEADMEM
ncbi:hypothetical protein GSI_01683 [Ganoderma sinense ZZ0214-1]|uniref:Uncharacterized protein n=1 Tax=Ganoderma sinense ZZ0214-1 TaxID=1077348 RepID=A0A2G8SQN2_9APHY|nr:hypothetical protein GSI_01683 [Ganoderma sinense ZZ0214-1]